MSAAKREAVKGLLRSLMKTSIESTRAVQQHMVGEDPVRRMNMICAEFSYFHMWRACKRARVRMTGDAYRRFYDYAVKGLAVTASGCFTGLFDKKAEQEYIVGLQNAFVVYEKCDQELLTTKDPMTSNCLISTLARRIVEWTGRKGDKEVTMKVIMTGMESFNASRVEEGVDAAAAAL